MAEPPAHAAEHLLAQAGWVRSLAARLVSDPHLVDDVVQDTLTTAIEHPPASSRPIRAWLALVVKNMVRQSHRSSSRRRVREELAARREREPSTLETLERLSVHKGLVEAVAELEEPYRTTLLLRYFDGLPPRRIAEIQDVPVKTVKTRLSRALARLRGRLAEQSGGDDSAWLGLLLPLLVLPGKRVGLATSWTLGAAAVNTKWMLTALAVTVFGLVGAVWLVDDPATDAPADLARPSDLALAANDAPADALETEPISVAARTGFAAPAESAAPVVVEPEPAPGPRTMHGRVVDVEGNPVAGLELQLRSRGRTEPVVDEHGVRLRSAPSGAVQFAAPDALASLEASSEGWINVLAGSVHPRSEIEPLVVVAPSIEIAGFAVDTTGAPVAGAAIALHPSAALDARFPRVLEGSQPKSFLARSDERGRFAFAVAPRLTGAALHASADGFRAARVPAPDHSTDAVEIVLVQHTPKAGHLVGQVVDPRGSPVAGARVAMGAYSTISDEAGEFSVDLAHAVSTARLVAVKPGYLPASVDEPEPFESGTDGWPGFVRLELGGPPLSITGRVVDERGRAVPGAQVWVADPTSFGLLGAEPVQIENLLAGAPAPHRPGPTAAELADRIREGGYFDEVGAQRAPSAVWSWVVTDSSGDFEVPGLTDRPYRLVALDPATLLRTESDPIAAGSRGVRLEMSRAGFFERVEGRVVTRDGAPLPGIRLRLVATPFQTQLHVMKAVLDRRIVLAGGAVTTDEGGRFVFERVPRTGISFSLGGDVILPFRFDPEEGWDPRSVEIVPTVKCHVDVVVDPTRADAIAFRDAQGEPVDVFMIRGGAVDVFSEQELVDGCSGVVAIAAGASEMLLLEQGAVVGRVPIEPIPGEVIELRP